MKRHYTILINAAVVIFASLFFAHSADAATVYITGDSNFAAVGDTAAVEVRVNTENERINVVDGDIVIDQAAQILEVQGINDAGSAIQYWSRKPSLSTNKKTISFVGGTPGGVAQKDALLFKIYFRVRSPGQVILVPGLVTVYKNDGLGTAISATSKQYLFTSSAKGDVKTMDAWKKVVMGDTMPPEFLAATEGQDPSMYDNKIFIAITATDYQSGIDHFEAQEGAELPVRTGSDYVLRDQSKQSRLVINAYDQAGNVRTLVILPGARKSSVVKYVEIGLAVLLALIITTIAFIVLKRKKNNRV